MGMAARKNKTSSDNGNTPPPDNSKFYQELHSYSPNTLIADRFYSWLSVSGLNSEFTNTEFLLIKQRVDSVLTDRFYHYNRSTLIELLNLLNIDKIDNLVSLALLHDFEYSSSIVPKLTEIKKYLTAASKNNSKSQYSKFKLIEGGKTPEFKYLLYKVCELNWWVPDYSKELLKLKENSENIKRISLLSQTTEKLLSNTYSSQLGISKNYSLIPIRVYMDGENSSFYINRVNIAIEEIGKEIGLELLYDCKPIFGSWFGSWFGFLSNKKSKKELESTYRKIKKSIELEYNEKAQADVNLKLVSSVAKLIKATKNIPVFATQIGSLLFVKFPDSEGVPKVLTKILTDDELIYIQKNQNILSNPKQIFDRLEKISTSNQLAFNETDETIKLIK